MPASLNTAGVHLGECETVINTASTRAWSEIDYLHLSCFQSNALESRATGRGGCVRAYMSSQGAGPVPKHAHEGAGPKPAHLWSWRVRCWTGIPLGVLSLHHKVLADNKEKDILKVHCTGGLPRKVPKAFSG